MEYITNIVASIGILFGSFFGIMPQGQIDQGLLPIQEKVHQLESNLTQKISQIESKIPTPETILGAYNITGGGTYRLKSSAGLSDSTINLSSFKEPVSNTPYTMTYLNTSIGYGTIEPQVPDRSEFISFTGITQNSDGSAQLTGVTRGINRTPQGNACTASTTLSIRHPAQSIFLYTSDSPCHFGQYAVKQNDETITGSWTVPAPTTGGNPTTKTYVDSVVNGGTVSYDRIAVAGTAGETVSAGQVLYFNTSDGEWYKAGVTTNIASTSILGIAQGSGVNGGAIASGVITQGLDTNQSGLTVGSNYFLGPTAGTITTATSSRVIGKARSTTSLYMDTSFLSDGLFSLSGATSTSKNNFSISGNTALATTTISGPLTVSNSGATSTITGKTVLDIATQSLPKISAGVTTYDMSTASGNQTIAHGLGLIPRMVKVTIVFADSSTDSNIAVGVYTTSAGAIYLNTDGGAGTSNSTGASLTLAVDGSNLQQGGLSAPDATNITIAWSKTGSPTGTARIIWEAYQ